MSKAVLPLIVAISVTSSHVQSGAPDAAAMATHPGHKRLTCDGTPVTRDIAIDIKVDRVDVKPPTQDACQGDKIVWTITNCNTAECGLTWVEVTNRRFYSGGNCSKPPNDFMAKAFLFFSCDFNKVVKQGETKTIECEVKDDACDTYKYDVLAHATREFKVARSTAPAQGVSEASLEFLVDPEVEVQGSTFPPPLVRSSPPVVPVPGPSPAP
jgi:hypothetical protein